MALEKITPPSFPGRGSDRMSLARRFNTGTMGYRGSGASPVLAKTSRHLVSKAQNALPTRFFGIERRNVVGQFFKLSL